MNRVVVRTCALAVLLLFHAVANVEAQGALKLPVTGSAAQGGTFTGTVAVTRFETRNNELVAIGFIAGTVTRGGRTIATALVGEVAIPVTVRAAGVTPANGRPSRQPQLRRVSMTTGTPRPEMKLVQAAPCSVVDVVLGPETFNIQGVVINVDPVAVQVFGEPGTPLGDLVCQLNEAIGNVAGLVGVLNTILNILILLLGGGLGIPLSA